MFAQTPTPLAVTDRREMEIVRRTRTADGAETTVADGVADGTTADNFLSGVYVFPKNIYAFFIYVFNVRLYES